jgi:hypothetical protein
VISALLAALALAAAAQSPAPYSGDEPAASTAPAVSSAAAVAASSAALVDVATSTGGVKIGTGAKAKLSRPLHAVIHADAKDWEPLAVKAGGDPFQVETKAVLRQEKVKGKYKGASSKAKASAHLYHSGKVDHWLVICVFPKALERRRMHFEVRLKIVEGFVEEAKASIVEVGARGARAGAGLDSFELRSQGVEFEEDSPASGTVLISALDPRPSKSALNAGTLKLAAFVDESVGLADASWSVKGLAAPR